MGVAKDLPSAGAGIEEPLEDSEGVLWERVVLGDEHASCEWCQGELGRGEVVVRTADRFMHRDCFGGQQTLVGRIDTLH
jgi:hypothetical protein